MRIQQTARHIATRGVYGQNDGSNNRGGKDSASANMTEYGADSAVAEGHEISVFARMLREHDWNGITSFREELKAKGWALTLIDRMLRQATVGVRI